MPSVEAAKLRRFPSSEAKERINVRAAGTSDGTKPCCLFPVGHNAVFTNTLELVHAIFSGLKLGNTA
jgi:hypothetical protein